MGQMRNPTADYCQLLLYTRYTNSAIVRSIHAEIIVWPHTLTIKLK